MSSWIIDPYIRYAIPTSEVVCRDLLELSRQLGCTAQGQEYEEAGERRFFVKHIVNITAAFSLVTYIYDYMKDIMRYLCVALLCMCSLAAYAQQEDIEITDKNDGTTYSVEFTDSGLIRKVVVDSEDGKSKFKLPKELDKYKWSKIKDGLWTTMKEPDEGFKTTFEGSRKFNVHYSGYLYENGEKFDSSLDRNEPLVGTYDRLIKGFSLGMANMAAGDFAAFKIAPEMGYGDKDLGVIPPGSTLVFYIYKIDEPGAAF